MQFRSRRAPVQACALVLSALAAACSDASSPLEPDAPQLARTAQVQSGKVTITPPASLVEAHDSVAVGVPVQFSARVTDRGRRKNPTLTWSVSSAPDQIASVRDGAVTTTAAGSVTVRVVYETDTASYDFTVKSGAAGTDSVPAKSDSTPTTPPATTTPPTTAGGVDMIVRRFDGGSGQTVVSAGVPLQPGALRPGQEGLVRVAVGGVEQRVYVAALSGTHGDGSLRAVLVQFPASVASGQSVPARLELGTPRDAAFTISTPLAAPGSAPAAFLPTDAEYLIATGIVGPTLSSAKTRALGGDFATYESKLTQYGDIHWVSEGDGWDGNYYDRALLWYAMWARTGNPDYWWRGTRQAVAYRRDYLEANGYRASPHWSQLEGLEKHYLLTGEEKSRVAIAQVAEILWTAYANSGGAGPQIDPRIVGRTLLAELLANRLGGASGVSVPAYGGAGASYASRMDMMLNQIAAWQTASGPSTGLYAGEQQYYCGGQYNFMAGLLNDALVKTYEHFRADARIRTIVQRSVDFMWNTQWRSAYRAFTYSTVECPNGSTEAAPDLNGLIVAPFGWLYKQTGNAAYRVNGDAVIGGSLSAWLQGSKQFNQTYVLSFQYFGWR